MNIREPKNEHDKQAKTPPLQGNKPIAWDEIIKEINQLKGIIEKPEFKRRVFPHGCMSYLSFTSFFCLLPLKNNNVT